MMQHPQNYPYWRKDLYKKINLRIFQDRTVLDLGCGTGDDAKSLSKIAKRVYAIDIEKHINWKKYTSSNLSFRIGDAMAIPFKNNYFDGLYLKDVLHHTTDPEKVIKEIDRVTKKGAKIVILEGNRYNPIFYLHMTKMHGHEHLSYTRFKEMINKRFKKVTYKQFESHCVPCHSFSMFKLILRTIEKVFDLPLLNKFRSYNLAIIEK